MRLVALWISPRVTPVEVVFSTFLGRLLSEAWALQHCSTQKSTVLLENLINLDVLRPLRV